MISTESAGRDSPSITEGTASQSRNGRRSEGQFAVVLAALYSATAFIYLVVPAIGRLNSVLLGSKLLPTDSLLGAGILEWGFRSLWSSNQHVFAWNVGFPVRDSLAVTENLIGWQLFYSPLRWSGVDVPAAYNIVLLLSLVISGVGAAMFSQRLGADRWGATIAGFIFAFAPFHLDNLMNLQTMAVCWVPFAFLFLDRFLENHRTSDAVGLFATIALAVFSGVYIGVFLAIMIPIYTALTWGFGRHRFDSRAATGLILIALAAAVAVSPLIYHYARFIADNGRYRPPIGNIEALSMELTAPLRTPAFQTVWSRTPLSTVLWNGEPAFLGVVAASLLIACVWIARKNVEARRTVFLLLSVSLVAYLLALGPNFQTVGRGPGRIVEWVPMPGRLWLLIPGIRWPSRIFFFALLGEAVLAGVGLTLIRKRGQTSWLTSGSLVVLGLIAIEYAPASWLAADSVNVSTPSKMSDSYDFLAHENDRGAIVELPTVSGPGRGLGLAGQYAYGASGHLRKLVASHGGRPLPAVDSLTNLALDLPNNSSQTELARRGVSRLVVHRFLGSTVANEKLIRSLKEARYQPVFEGRESVVFNLLR